MSVTPAAFAQRLGVSRTAVMQRIRSGSLPTSARKVGGRWAIDTEKAISEWRSLTRPRVGETSAWNEPAPAPRLAHPCVAAYFELQDLVVRIEVLLDAHLKFLVKRIPKAPATTWAAVHAEWEKLPDALVRLRSELKLAVPLFAEGKSPWPNVPPSRLSSSSLSMTPP
jgi:hypothetical protein